MSGMQKFDTAKILDGLNEKQKEAVQTTRGPLLVILARIEFRVITS